MTSKQNVLSLFRYMLRESQKFQSYNFRNYAVRRIRETFRENKNLTNLQQIEKEYNFGLNNMEIIKRQVSIGQMYAADKLVIEKVNKAQT